MTIAMRRILYLVLGLLAALAIWGAQELLLVASVGLLTQSIAQGALIGLGLGYAFGAAEGIAISERRKAALTGALGAVLGAIAGGLATVGAGVTLIAIANASGADRARMMSVLLPLCRVLAWGVVGAVVAVSEGLRGMSLRRSVAGALGGLVGGLLGGAGLELLIRTVENPAVGRLVGFVALGLGVALLLGEFERRFSFARLRVLTGPLRNKEYLLSKRRSSIGAALLSDVYLAAYKEVEPSHAMIVQQRGELRITTTADDVRVNEKPVSEDRFLKYEDVIDLGGTRLLLLPS